MPGSLIWSVWPVTQSLGSFRPTKAATTPASTPLVADAVLTCPIPLPSWHPLQDALTKMSLVLVGVPPAGTKSYPRLKVLTIGTGVAVEAKATAFGVFVPVPGALPLMMIPKRCASAAL